MQVGTVPLPLSKRIAFVQSQLPNVVVLFKSVSVNVSAVAGALIVILVIL